MSVKVALSNHSWRLRSDVANSLFYQVCTLSEAECSQHCAVHIDEADAGCGFQGPHVVECKNQVSCHCHQRYHEHLKVTEIEISGIVGSQVYQEVRLHDRSLSGGNGSESRSSRRSSRSSRSSRNCNSQSSSRSS